MPSWKGLIRERLGALDFAAERREEILDELADHLEQVCEERRTQGLSEFDAMRSALDEVEDWRELAQRIRFAKEGEGSMINQIRRLWLPGAASLTASIGWLILAEPGYWAWFIAQPLFGVLGAYLSWRAGGDRLTQLAAGFLFPAVVMGYPGIQGLAMWATFSVGEFVQTNLLHQPIHFSPISHAGLLDPRLMGFSRFMLLLTQFVLPSLVLLLGAALPFFKTQKVQET